jgi:hypothetical protein
MRPITFEQAKAQYVYRYTMEHVPAWALRTSETGKYYAPQYSTDAEWYDNTRFPGEHEVGAHDGHCMSTNQSWPLGHWLDAPFGSMVLPGCDTCHDDATIDCRDCDLYQNVQVEFETFKTAVVSTAHLSCGLAAEMEEGTELGFPYDKCSEYAYRVYIPLHDGNPDWPEETKPLMLAAKAQGYKWVEFDCDGDTHDEFQTWEW